MSRTLVIELPWPDRLLWLNSRGANRYAVAEKVKKAKRAGEVLCRAARGREAWQWPGAQIALTFHPKPRGRRPDIIDNCPASVKPYMDGIAKDLGCDDGKFSYSRPPDFGPRVIYGKVVVTITPPAVADVPIIGTIS